MRRLSAFEAPESSYKEGREMDFPVKKKAKARRIEKRTVFIFRDNEKVAIRKRPQKDSFAGMYEFPNVEGHLRTEEVIGYAQTAGLTPVRVKRIGTAKHIFSHVEWHMTGYELLVDELENVGAKRRSNVCGKRSGWIGKYICKDKTIRGRVCDAVCI